MAGNKKGGKGGGARKYGRRKNKCQRYLLMGKREINKARKQAKHQKQVAKKAARKARRDAAV